jgi:hypothetical protein
LLDLQQQRSDLITKTQQQEYDILTQGNLVGQRTRAQQGASQIGDLERQKNDQLKQIDQQIAAAQDRFDIEKKIFGLSQDRTQLEAELVILQHGQHIWYGYSQHSDSAIGCTTNCGADGCNLAAKRLGFG